MKPRAKIYPVILMSIVGGLVPSNGSGEMAVRAAPAFWTGFYERFGWFLGLVLLFGVAEGILVP